MLIAPTKIACAQCGAETDYHSDVPEEATVAMLLPFGGLLR
jgi:hypothetical protein